VGIGFFGFNYFSAFKWVLDNLRYSRSITRNLMKKVFTKTSR
jgi:hypothetical protein